MRKPAAKPLPSECFLSHSHHDQPFATQVANVLRKHGVPVWYAPTQLRGSQKWQDEIGYALRRCDWFALILSASAVRSIWVERELKYVLSKRRFHNRIVPILYRNCNHEKLSWTLGSSYQMVDLRVDFDEGFRDLLQVWDVEYHKF